MVGAGLAGSEAAWQLAKRGIRVKLYEMRPHTNTPAHHTADPAELVCSNSLGSNHPLRASGLLKEELRSLSSLLIDCADRSAVPAGQSLSVDRKVFSKLVKEQLLASPEIELVTQEVKQIPPGFTILASGPLTSSPLAEAFREYFGSDLLYFFDAVSPVVTTESLDLEKIYPLGRYRPEEKDYLNCPMNKEEYLEFYHALIKAELAPVKDFEKKLFFEGCLPVEELASRGVDTLRFGPLKPVGLPDPGDGKLHYAVVQLRQEDKAGNLYGLVGFQTRLKWGEQERVFRLIPGLEKAEFVRLGNMHKNLFLNAPLILQPSCRTKKRADLFLAGQITGVEGYVECMATGLLSGINLARVIKGEEPLTPPRETALGSLLYAITTAHPKKFQPININFGLLLAQQERVKDKKERNRRIVEKARGELAKFLKEI